MVDLVEHRVASGVDVAVLADRVKLAPGRQRGEHLSSMEIDALRVLILLGASTGEGDRAAPPRVLEDRDEPQDLAGSDRRLRVVGSQVSVLWDRHGDDLQIIAALYVIAMSCSSTKQRRDRATPMTLPLRDHRRRRARARARALSR